MSVLINFKICDNARECMGIEACPTKALYWNKEKKTIAFDENKCNKCGLCEKSCEISAIRVAKDDDEYEKIKKEIENDSREVSDLFVDRYGATPIHTAFQLNSSDFDVTVLESTKLVALEVYQDDSIECLLRSIPIGHLFQGRDVKFRKMKVEDEFLKKYSIENLPTLLFFRDGAMLGKIEGFYSFYQKDVLDKKIESLGVFAIK
ncbi:MAG: 4Fe-4S binding protein [Candidatus Moranbacteria bacterium]|nr:4Fe-4S binding protein [Candidatus Moranbacteria bacterium]